MAIRKLRNIAVSAAKYFSETGGEVLKKRLRLFGIALLALATGQGLARQAETPVATVPQAISAPAIAPPARDPELPQVAILKAPSWVASVPLTAAAGKGGAILRLLDVQMRIDESGLHTFQHSVIRFNTSAALQMATNFSVEWQPAHGTATVHSLLIHRDGKVIDLLAGGAKFTTLRREAQLGTFQIDGQLTAFIQVTDLRVGDELEFSHTVSTSNAVLAGHVEQEYFTMPGAQIDQIYLSESHPKKRRVAVRWGPTLPPRSQREAGGFVTTVATAQAFTSPTLDGATAFQQIERGSIQISDFASWTDVANVMRPGFEEAATLSAGSPVDAQIAKIAATHSDPVARANAALRLVQREVRYLAELQGLGGYKPLSADSVWERRIGDCKGKTVLLLAMLRGLGIDAEPLLVSTKRGEGTDAALPMPGRFDHVIVLARIGDKEYWLDGTRRDSARLEDLESPDFLWGLPLSVASKGLVPIPSGVYRQPQSEWHWSLDATSGLDTPAKASGKAILRGDDAQVFAQAVEVLQAAELDKLLKGLWTRQRQGVTVDKNGYEIDSETGEFRLTFTGTIKIDWSRSGKNPRFRYQVSDSALGTNLVGDHENPPPADQPVIVSRRSALTSETMLLPDGGKGFSLEGDDIDETIGGVRYTRKAKLDGGKFVMTVGQTSPRLALTLPQALEADEGTDDLFARALYLRLPAAIAVKDAAGMAEVGTEEIDEMIGSGHLGAARELIDARLTASPRNAGLLAQSGTLHYVAGEQVAALRDLDTALALSPRLPLALVSKAKVLVEKGQLEDALLLLDRAVLVNPEENQLYILRGNVREDAGDLDGALADWTVLVGKFPAERWPRWHQTRLLTRLGRPAEALASARELQATTKNKADGHWLLTEVLTRQGKGDEARKELRAADAGKLDPAISGIRLSYGLSGTPDQYLSDALIYIRANPANSLPDDALVIIAKDPKRLARLLAAYDAEAARPGAPLERIAIERASAQRAAGDPRPLDQVLAKAEADRPGDMELRNQVCWRRAIWRIDLKAARASCDAAIKQSRLAMYVDSLAMVELQDGNYPAAVRLYTEALRTLPRSAPTLYGRGIARLRTGDKGGEADLALAREVEPKIDRQFEFWGLKP